MRSDNLRAWATLTCIVALTGLTTVGCGDDDGRPIARDAGSGMDSGLAGSDAGDIDAGDRDSGTVAMVDAGPGPDTDAGPGPGTDAGPGPGTDAGPGPGTDAGPGDLCAGVDCSAMDTECRVGTCNPATGACGTTNRADGTACSDGSMCTTGDSCSAGACVGGAAPSCDDGNVCTTDSCVAATGCAHTNNTASCDDGSACTTGDVCAAGACTGGTAVVCNDGNVCTTDTCAAATGCVYTNNTAACTDGSACTTGDVCSGGACTGTPVVCNDSNSCTTDTCAAATGCVYTPAAEGTTCSDGRACSTGDVCTGGICAGRSGALAFRGFASWTQTATSQTDVAQDALMDAACVAAFPGSHAATTVDLVSARIAGLPATNTSALYATGKCPNCAGSAHAACASGHARNCVNPAAAWPASATTWTSEPNCHTGTRTAVCVVPRLEYMGIANWTQTATSQSDAVQDAAMDTACNAAFAGSRAATIAEIVSGTISGRPATNTSANYTVGKCPNCAGSAHAACTDGHARNCVNPGAAWPTVPTPWSSEPNCHTGTRGAVCVRNMACPFRGFATWTQAATTQSDVTQDSLMNAACTAAFAGSAAATVEEISSGVIRGLPATNTSGNYAVGRCPSCEGAAHAACVDGHARNCVNPGSAFPASFSPWPLETNCHSSPRSAVCF